MVLALGCAAFAALWMRARATSRRVATDIKNFCATYRVRQNFLRCLDGVYYLVSIDGGRNWIELKHQTDGECTLVGPATLETMQMLDANATLAADARKNGSINPLDERRMALLNAAGVSVGK